MTYTDIFLIFLLIFYFYIKIFQNFKLNYVTNYLLFIFTQLYYVLKQNTYFKNNINGMEECWNEKINETKKNILKSPLNNFFIIVRKLGVILTPNKKISWRAI